MSIVGEVDMASGLDYNAPIDPFNAEYRPEEAVADFLLLKPSWIFRNPGPLPRYEQVREEPAAYFTPDVLPKAVIFVSHRWDSLQQPDASGNQADGIRYFLTAVLDIARGLKLELESSAKADLDLFRHGRFQAAYFYDQGMSFITKDDCDGWSALHPAARVKQFETPGMRIY
jgi:hypothetical protein